MCTGPQKLDTKLREYTGDQAKGNVPSGRRKHAPEFKAKVVTCHSYRRNRPRCQECRRYGIKDSLLSTFQVGVMEGDCHSFTAKSKICVGRHQDANIAEFEL